MIHVGNATGQTIMLKATQSERELIVKDFAQRCKGIIKEAMRWAPYTMKSHIRVSGVLSRRDSCFSLVATAVFPCRSTSTRGRRRRTVTSAWPWPPRVSSPTPPSTRPATAWPSPTSQPGQQSSIVSCSFVALVLSWCISFFVILLPCDLFAPFGSWHWGLNPYLPVPTITLPLQARTVLLIALPEEGVQRQGVRHARPCLI